MKNKSRFLSRALTSLLLTHAVAVVAESYTVQPGDILSSIAKKRREQSDNVLNTEQIMLTLYSLNRDAFINGDINKLMVAKKITIPDTNSEYIQISKQEARQRLKEKNYTATDEEGFVPAENSSKAPVNVSKSSVVSSARPEYAQIMQTLNAHQQNIEVLKVENAHITRSFKLLERALGRIVLVQGLMTNDLMKVKSTLQDKSGKIGDESLSLAPVRPLDVVPASANLAQETKDIAESAPLPADSKKVRSPALAESAASDLSANTALDSRAVQEVAAPASSTAVSAVNPVSTPVEASGAVEEDNAWLNWVMIGSILLPLSLVLAWALDFREIRSRRMLGSKSSPEADVLKVSAKEKLLASSDQGRYAGVGVLKTSQEEVVEPKLSVDMHALGDEQIPVADNELVSALEHLDMCLLFGDYKQARSVTMQAMDGYQDSPVLARKIAFIERKLAKA